MLEASRNLYRVLRRHGSKMGTIPGTETAPGSVHSRSGDAPKQLWRGRGGVPPWRVEAAGQRPPA
eukprot:2372346-Pyramimonas_sp.AAC.1